MKRKLTLIFDTDADTQKIIDEVRRWMNDEFWHPNEVEMSMEDVK